MNKKSIAVLLIGFLAAHSVSAGADAFFLSDPVEICGNHYVDNDQELISGRHTFILTAFSDAPMPQGSEGEEKRVTINSNEEFSFGQIRFTQPGSYLYRVSREILPAEDLMQDDSVYFCHVTVYPDGQAVVVFEKEGTEGKPNRIAYRDKYTPPSETTARGSPPGKDPPQPLPVDMGDPGSLLPYTLCFSASLLTLLGMASQWHRHSKKEQARHNRKEVAK